LIANRESSNCPDGQFAGSISWGKHDGKKIHHLTLNPIGDAAMRVLQKISAIIATKF
jgi:hypothetical protein